MVIGDVEVTRRQLCCCHSFVFRQRVFHFKSEGGSVLLSFISLLSNYQHQCVVHFKSEGHQGAWGDCVVVSQLFSTLVCHSFQKSGSPVGFVVSACLQRCLGGCGSSS